jgi:radical SAM superfamily enzyme YgiQ (UPF0313 family)
MKIQLIHPPVLLNLDALTALRPSLPLGLAYIAAVLEKAGHGVGVIDAVSEAPDQVVKAGRLFRMGLSAEQISARVEPDTQAIGISNMWSFSWSIVREMIHVLRRDHPHLKIVCGGEHFSGLPEHSMQEAPIDFCAIGEGEDTAVALFAAIAEGREDFSDVPGIVWRRKVAVAAGVGTREQGGAVALLEGPPTDDAERTEIVRNPRRDRTRAVDEIPWPAWHLFDVLKYDEKKLIFGIHYGRTIPILATRGCPYQCSYCSSPRMWTTRWYARDPKDVADEIQSYVEKYGATNFPFQDLTAILKREWILSFARELISRGLEITWQLPSGTRCEVVDEEVAELLYRSGCRSLNFAPESGSEETRKEIKKRMKTESFLEAVRAAVKHKLNLSCFIVLGFPKDTVPDLKASVKLARQLARMGVDDICCAFFFPLPATELYDYLVEKGRIRLDDAFLETPLHTHDRFLTEQRNYCEQVPARVLNRYRYAVLLNFYAVSFLTHPSRFFRLVYNVITGRETTKLDGFFNETKRKLWLSVKSLFKRRKAAVPEILPARS